MAHALASGRGWGMRSLGATQQPLQEGGHLLAGSWTQTIYSFFLLISQLFFLHLSLSFQSHHLL